MTDKERLEFIKETHKIQGAKSNDFWGFVRDDVDFLIQQAEIAQDLKVYVGENSEKSAKLNLFLQERNKPEYLGLHVVDAVMKYVKVLESLYRIEKECSLDLLARNNRYREALEFYADEETYDNTIYDEWGNLEGCLAEMDCGHRARQALEGEK